MALRSASLFLYGFEITANNRFISFRAVALETPRTATLNAGFYSLSTLGDEIERALAAADPARTYSVTADRTVFGGLQNRVSIATNGTYFDLLFSSGNPSNPASLIGFDASDYTGSTTYAGSASAGTVLIPNQVGYSFLPTSAMQKNFGALNISASGLKEAIVFNLQSFWQVQFKYIPEDLVDSDWLPLIQWMIQQRDIDFTPNITDPSTFYTGTLESPNQGLDFNLSEMLPSFPFNYQTPLMKFRVRNI
jgi:hypothetical protein